MDWKEMKSYIRMVFVFVGLIFFQVRILTEDNPREKNLLIY